MQPPTPHRGGDGTAVYLVDQGLSHLAQEDLSLCVYDDATAQLLVVKGGCVFAYDALAQGPHSLRWMYPLQEGPPVRTLRPSPDNKLLALQRSSALIELVNLETGNCFVHSIHKGKGEILAFFFAEAPEVDFVVVTTRAVELLQFAARRQGLRLKERVRTRSTWCTYTHDTRMFVAAAAPASTQLLAWQFTASSITRLPAFELRGPLPLSSAARDLFPAHLLEAPSLAQQQQQQQQRASAGAGRAGAAGMTAAQAGAGAARIAEPAGTAGATFATIAAAAVSALSGGAGISTGSSSSGSGPVAVAQASVALLKVYGRVYIAHVDSTARRLELYRVYTDTIILQHLYEVYAPEVVLSVVDNVIVVHHPATAVVMLLDVALEGPQPVANPLPLKRLDLLSPSQAGSEADAQLGSSSMEAVSPVASAGGAGASGSDGSSSGNGTSNSSSRGTTAAEGAVASTAAEPPPPPQQQQQQQHFRSSDAHHSASWRYCMPNVVLDAASSTLFRLHLDLRAVADSCGDAPRLVGFLQRRRSPPVAHLAADPRALLLSVIRSALQERLPMASLRPIFDHLSTAYADALMRAGAASGATAATATAAAAAATAAATAAGGGEASQHQASPPAPVTVVTPNELAQGLFRWAHDEEVVDSLYLQAAVTHYRASAEAVGVPLPLYLLRLSVDVLLQGGQQYQAVQLLSSQPGMGLGLLGQAGADGRGVLSEGGRGGGAVGSVAAQLALDVGARQACMGQQQAAGSVNSNGATTEPHVRALLASGQVLRAARLARAHNVTSVPPLQFLEAAARAGDAWAFAAAYRVWHEPLRGVFLTLAAARQHFGAAFGGAGGADGNGAAANAVPQSRTLQAAA